MTETHFTPFLKAPEGSAREIGKIAEKLPMDLGVLINRCADPFLGRGSLLFRVMSVPGMDEAVVSDIDAELINTYRQVQSHVDDLLDELQVIENKFTERSYEEKADFYKSVLCRYQYLCSSSRTDIALQKAAMFLFLNAAEYITQKQNSGRIVTSRGTEIILPGQAMKMSRICDERALRICSRLLEKVKIRCCDFRECLEYVDDKTLLCLDPPAVNQKKTAYPFTKEDMQSVFSIYRIARSLGAEVILSEKAVREQQ
jgi:DNA adenine methylase